MFLSGSFFLSVFAARMAFVRYGFLYCSVMLYQKIDKRRKFKIHSAEYVGS